MKQKIIFLKKRRTYWLVFLLNKQIKMTIEEEKSLSTQNNRMLIIILVMGSYAR